VAEASRVRKAVVRAVSELVSCIASRSSECGLVGVMNAGLGLLNSSIGYRVVGSTACPVGNAGPTAQKLALGLQQNALRGSSLLGRAVGMVGTYPRCRKECD